MITKNDITLGSRFGIDKGLTTFTICKISEYKKTIIVVMIENDGTEYKDNISEVVAVLNENNAVKIN